MAPWRCSWWTGLRAYQEGGEGPDLQQPHCGPLTVWTSKLKLKLPAKGHGWRNVPGSKFKRDGTRGQGYVMLVCALRSYFWGNHWGSGRGEECFTSGVLSGMLKVVKRSDCLFKVILQTQWSCLVDAAVHPNQVWLHHGWEQGWSFQHHHGHGDWVRAGCLGGDSAQVLAAPVCATLGQFLKWKFKTDVLCFCQL